VLATQLAAVPRMPSTELPSQGPRLSDDFRMSPTVDTGVMPCRHGLKLKTEYGESLVHVVWQDIVPAAASNGSYLSRSRRRMPNKAKPCETTSSIPKTVEIAALVRGAPETVRAR